MKFSNAIYIHCNDVAQAIQKQNTIEGGTNYTGRTHWLSVPSGIFDEIVKHLVDSMSFEITTQSKDASTELVHWGNRETVGINIGGAANTDSELIYLHFSASSEDRAAKFEDLIEKIKALEFREEEKGVVYALMQDRDGLDAEALGSDYHELERDNYSQDVLDAHDKIIEEFPKKDCPGFISIFMGPPGTGKTYLIRSIIGKIPNANFLYMPPAMIQSVSGPSLLKVFADMADTTSENPDKLILILEDADEVLAPRLQTNMGGISTLLNLTDGTLGRLLGIRVIATTNSPDNALDKAITRPGRMLCMGEVLPHKYEKALEIYKKHGGKEELPEDSYTISELYDLIRNPDKLKDLKPKQRRVGFQ